MPDRQPPYAPEAEVAVLGGMLIDPAAVNAAMERLTEREFYAERNRRVYRSMLALVSRGVPVEPVTLREEMSRTDQLECIGGWQYIGELMDAVPTAANVGYHADIVKDCAIRRKLIEAGSEMIRDAYEPGERDTPELIASAQERVYAVGDGTARGEFEPLRKLLFPIFEKMEQGEIPGTVTGLGALDDKIGSLRPGTLTILAARPSMGKTALGMGIAANVAVQNKEQVAVFSLEMSKDELIERLLASEALVDLSRIVRRRLMDEDYVRLSQAAGPLNEAPMWIDDTGGMTAVEIRAKARRLKSENPKLALILVDYLTLMNGGQGDNMHQTVGYNARNLKEMAKELHVPVLALAQLSRKPEERADKRPILSDLRESGNIEEHADNVWLLFRPEYYMDDIQAQEKGAIGGAELIVAKQRNGSTGVVKLFFRKECARFEDIGWGVRAA